MGDAYHLDSGTAGLPRLDERDAASAGDCPYESAISRGVLAGAALAALLKVLFDRARPALADSAITPLVDTPDSPSFPSGHTATAFAAAAVVGAFHPRLRWPLYGLAALVALSRVYLGVHFWLDVLAGAALGLAIGLRAAWAGRRIQCRLRTSPRADL